jgi:hypothetical protein
VFLLAVIPARLLVADALGLPPQDFEITVAVWSILLYPAVWLFMTAVCTFLICVVFLLLALLLDLTTTPLLDLPLRTIGHLFPEVSRPCTFLEAQRHVLSYNAWGHAVGAMCATFFVLYLLVGYDHTAKGLKPVVRWIAYLADFQDVPRYPGLERGKRTRIHENGVVSYAEPSGWDISISVTRVSDGDAK